MLDINFVKSIYQIRNLPKENVQEVILCGRSNVGKSTFINSLSKKKNIAKTSSTPGKTKSLNFYSVENKFYFVDLPGYGYAKTSIKEKEQWQKLIKNYLYQSKNIAMAFHLIDSRHKPTNLDVMFNQLLKSLSIPYIVILSKIDKLNQSEKIKSIKRIVEYFPELSLNDNLIPYSSLKGIGNKNIKIMLSKLFM